VRSAPPSACPCLRVCHLRNRDHSDAGLFTLRGHVRVYVTASDRTWTDLTVPNRTDLCVSDSKVVLVGGDTIAVIGGTLVNGLPAATPIAVYLPTNTWTYPLTTGTWAARKAFAIAVLHDSEGRYRVFVHGGLDASDRSLSDLTVLNTGAFGTDPAHGGGTASAPWSWSPAPDLPAASLPALAHTSCGLSAAPCS
jgi:hypothetical protein